MCSLQYIATHPRKMSGERVVVAHREPMFCSRLDSSLELIEAIDLQKDDICTFVTFVSNWPQT
jgi:hypothetical protein